MKPVYEKDEIQIYQGDCLEVMKNLPDNSIDTIITDPPYSLSSIKKRFGKTSIDDDNITGKNALNGSNEYARLSKGFMGKEWDNEIAFNPEVWRECLRVAKPGAFLLAFGGTRTFHRLMVAIEDAGWEIRDCIMWIYGSGFPKSLDIGKAIDKAKGAEREVVGKKIDISSGKPMSVKQAKAGTDYNLHEGYDRPWRKDDSKAERMTQVTAPSTPLAQTFDGYGTALKPSYEPIVIAMKPLDGTFTNNAEVWGLAGLNIDGGRVLIEDDINQQALQKNFNSMGYNGASETSGIPTYSPKGRWPANVILDGSDEVQAEFDKAGVSVSRGGKSPKRLSNRFEKTKGMFTESRLQKSMNLGGLGDKGSPARFFYTAKASQSERGQGNNHPTVKPLSLLRYLCKLTKTPYGGVVLDPFMGSGTTLIAARAENREAIGIDITPEYCEIAANRLSGEIDVSPNDNRPEPEDRQPKQQRLF